MLKVLSKLHLNCRSHNIKNFAKREMSEQVSKSMLSLALLQLNVTDNKVLNIEHVSKAIQKSCSQSTKIELLVLPECWNSPYSTASFPLYAEEVPNVNQQPQDSISPSIYMLCQKAKAFNVWIVGGSIPEQDGSSLYNTCVIIDSNGTIVGKHRKIHLFDIDVPGKIKFKESDALSAGTTPTLVQTPWGPIGVGICYDIRFPEYAMLLRQLGAKLLVYPGAFNMVTGPAHWELLQRARAVDNQLFVAACSPARVAPRKEGDYIAWGHSTVISPWGEVLATTDEKEDTVFATLDMSTVDATRDSIPCWKQKRNDIYSLNSKFL